MSISTTNQLQESHPEGEQSAAKAAPIRRDRAIAVAERIRPELNLEKWSIWQPSKSKNKSAPQARTIRRETTLRNGVKVLAEVEVGYTQRGVLTTEDQRTYYALIKQWEDTGRSVVPTY